VVMSGRIRWLTFTETQRHSSGCTLPSNFTANAAYANSSTFAADRVPVLLHIRATSWEPIHFVHTSRLRLPLLVIDHVVIAVKGYRDLNRGRSRTSSGLHYFIRCCLCISKALVPHQNRKLVFRNHRTAAVVRGIRHCANVCEQRLNVGLAEGEFVGWHLRRFV